MAAACGFGVVAVLLRSSREARTGLTADPDTYMRLAVLEHQLATSLTNYAFPRDGAPFGMQIHWTLPFDLLIVGLAAPLAPVLGWHGALAAAGQFALFVSLAILALAITSLCRALGRRDDAPWAIAIVAASPVVMGYATLGMVNHHVLAVALGLFAITAALRLLRTMRPREGAWAAFWAVLAVWESLECDLPVLVAAAVVAAAAGLRRDRGGVRSFALLAPLLALLVLLLDPPPEGRWALSADRLSLLQVTMFAAVGVAAFVVQIVARPGASGPARRIWAGAAAFAVFLTWAGPALLFARPIRSDDAFYTAYYWNSVAELQPGWAAGDFALTALIPTVFGVLVVVALAWRRQRQRWLWLAMTGLLGLELLAGFVSVRLATHGAALSSVLIGATVRTFLQRRTLNPAFVLLAFCTAGIVGGGAAIAFGWADRHEPSCTMGPRTAADLALKLPEGAVVAADLWASPEILWRTKLRTIAGPYHRDWSGIEDLAHVFLGTDDAAIRAILARRQAAAIVICATEENFGRDIFAVDSLGRRLAHGRIPDWLRPVPVQPGGNPDFRLFLIVR